MTKATMLDESAQFGYEDDFLLVENSLNYFLDEQSNKKLCPGRAIIFQMMEDGNEKSVKKICTGTLTACKNMLIKYAELYPDAEFDYSCGSVIHEVGYGWL